jgi:hypothetical protein
MHNALTTTKRERVNKMNKVAIKEAGKKAIVTAVEEINNMLGYDPAIATKGKASVIAKGLDDRFSEKGEALEVTDFEPGSKACLSVSTVKLLIALEVSNVPKEWADRIEDAEDAEAAAANTETEAGAEAEQAEAEADEKPAKKGKAKPAKKDKPAKKEKVKKEKKITQASVMNDAIADKLDGDAIVALLVETFDIDEKKAKSRYNLHLNWIKRNAKK